MQVAGDLKVAREQQQALDALGRAGLGDAERMLGEHDRLLSRAARRCFRCSGTDRVGQRGVGLLGREGQVKRTQLRVADRAGEPFMHLATLAWTCTAPRGRGKQRMRGAHAVTVDDQEPAGDRIVDRGSTADHGELRHTRVAAQRHGEQQSAQRSRQPRNPGAEHGLDFLRHRDLVDRHRNATLEERSPELEREQRIPQGGVDDAAQDLSLQR